MQAGMTGTLMPNLAEINRIRKQLVERTAGECVAARLPAVLCDPDFGADASPIQIFHQEPDATELQISAKYLSHRLRFRLIDHQATLMHVVADRDQTTHPYALLLGSGDLVADSLPRHLALKLGEGQQDVECQASHR